LHHINDFEQPLKLRLAYAGENASRSDETLIFSLPWQEAMNIPQALLNETEEQNPRTQEWETAALRGLVLDTLTLQLPPGFQPTELPDEIKDASDFGRYRFTYKLENNADNSTGATLIVTREVLMAPLRVSLEEAPAYEAFCQSIARESRRRIVLKK
jgi:hypothetical protein